MIIYIIFFFFKKKTYTIRNYFFIFICKSFYIICIDLIYTVIIHSVYKILTDIKNKIPTNYKKKNFFEILVHDNFIDVLFEWQNLNNLENFYLLLKSYILSKEILLKNIFIIASNDKFLKDGASPSFFRNLNARKIEKMNFFDFKIFYSEMLESDFEYYLNSYEFYGIRITFFKESSIWESKKFYPIYPWDENLKKLFIVDNKLKKILKENYILKQKLKHSVYKNAYKRRN